MDPEIEAPVVMIPFGGLNLDRAEDDNALALQMISQTTPEYAGRGFYYRCTRIIDVLLIKVLVARTARDRSCSQRPDESTWDAPLN